MRITADTSILVRAMTGDDVHQSKLARDALAGAVSVALALPALCELVWVLTQGYKAATSDVAAAIRDLLDAANVVVDRPAAEAGLAALDAGGDFADGVIAYQGSLLGADAFVSFDRRAVKLLAAQGQPAHLLT